MTRTPAFDAERFERLRQAQHGVVTRVQALACGLTPKAIHYRLRSGGPWQRLLPAVYLTMTGSASADHKAVAARLYAGPRSLISGPIAVRRHHLTCPGPDTVDVLVPWTCQVQSAGFVRVHRTRNMPEKCHRTGLIAFVPTPRAVADAARWLSRLDDVRAVVSEALIRRACTIEELAAELNSGGMPWSRLLRVAITEAEAGTRSVAEAKFRKLLLRSGLPEPVFNAQIFDERGEFIAMLDAWWPDSGVGAEIDSRRYHLSAADQEATRHRHDRITARGVLLLHFSPGRLDTDGQGIIREIRETIKQGSQRPAINVFTVPLAA